MRIANARQIRIANAADLERVHGELRREGMMLGYASVELVYEPGAEHLSALNHAMAMGD